MTAPERFADSQIPLAPRAPSIHDPKRSCVEKIQTRPRGVIVMNGAQKHNDAVHALCTRHGSTKGMSLMRGKT
jgi:hypothetical protein